MSHLLDTHALLWWLDGDARLSRRARSVIEDDRHTVYVSAASVWEIATKSRLGKLPKARPVAQRLPDVLDEQGFVHLPITVRHAHHAGWLPEEHRDPFDRMLAAQAIVERLAVLTIDRGIAGLGARVVW